jgi:hypothetical protein
MDPNDGVLKIKDLFGRRKVIYNKETEGKNKGLNKITVRKFNDKPFKDGSKVKEKYRKRRGK